MRSVVWTLLCIPVLSFAYNSTKSIPSDEPPHLDLQTDSQTLQKLYNQHLKSNPSPLFTGLKNPAQDGQNRRHQQILEMGRINLEWLALINSEREQPIVLYNPGELKGIPVEKPSSYGPTTIEANFTESLQLLPELMRETLLGHKAPTPQLPAKEVEEYRSLAKKIDRLYSITLRWEMMKGWLRFLAGRRNQDIRGYHFLSQKDDRSQYLKNMKSYPQEEQEQVLFWLKTLCYNSIPSAADQSRRFENCDRESETAVQAEQAFEFSQRHWSQAKARYESFFRIPEGVRNASTRKQGQGLISQFRPTSPVYRDFLKTHIEDEFRLHDFQLEVTFAARRGRGVFVEWAPDVTPHVKGLGSDHIVMNSRSSLEDWNTQWIIRHEFGHVLGLPDCYVEFYEPDKGVITNYQIDVEDLMCSRAGKMNQRIRDELRKAYSPESDRLHIHTGDLLMRGLE